MEGTSEERNWAMFIHLSGLLGSLVMGLGCIVVPLILWLIKRETSSFVNDQGKEVLNFQITFVLVQFCMGIAIFGSWFLGLVAFPLFFVGGLLVLIEIAYVIFMIVSCIKGTIQANNGQYYRYALSIRFIS